MEIAELQKLWVQYDNRIAENTRVNKGILKKIITSKTENKITWIRRKAIFNLLIPIPILIYIAYDFDYRADTSFYTGLVVAGLCTIITYAWAVKYYLLIDRIDFLNSMMKIKKDLAKLKQYKLKITRWGYMLAPIYIIGIFLFAGIPFLSTKMIPVYLLCLLVAGISTYLTRKYGIFEQLKKVDAEIEEIEQLEKE